MILVDMKNLATSSSNACIQLNVNVSQYQQKLSTIHMSQIPRIKSCETPHLVAVQTTIDLYLQSPLPLF
ncbi:hypothetical protein DERF_003995 [Dermatophagoides farinae]|uniref:Uncharacterized protein n=1 Tax=Dermatophagoides farinae TaxID=6954 RepID=A0A922LDR2_DERFA|nr:hypothetical protein DERF_003995 [Dermatophagoides farinae]